MKVKSRNVNCLSESVMHLEAFMHSLHLELPEELQVHDIYQSV